LIEGTETPEAGGGGRKSEDRNPKAERSPKSEARIRQNRQTVRWLRFSALGFLSAFGLRIYPVQPVTTSCDYPKRDIVISLLQIIQPTTWSGADVSF
jgi:hypothetical protein